MIEEEKKWLLSEEVANNVDWINGFSRLFILLMWRRSEFPASSGAGLQEKKRYFLVQGNLKLWMPVIFLNSSTGLSECWSSQDYPSFPTLHTSLNISSSHALPFLVFLRYIVNRKIYRMETNQQVAFLVYLPFGPKPRCWAKYTPLIDKNHPKPTKDHPTEKVRGEGKIIPHTRR